MFMNNSVGEEEGKKTELKRAATVCRLYKTSVLHYGSAHCKLLSFSFLDCSKLGLAIVFFILCIIDAHCSAKIQTGLKKIIIITIVMRCLFFFYRIILPSDSVTLKRMSYNVKSAKSVLFSHPSLKRNI